MHAPRPDLAAHLHRLATVGLVQRAAASLDLEYLFRHGLIQDAAYSSLLRRQRRRYHQQVGEALEALHPDRLDELAPLLAQHFAAAGQPGPARAAIPLVRWPSARKPWRGSPPTRSRRAWRPC
ncbi:MAG TPA: hypothetical protein VKY74_22130 [Chloroflexia bacterium]|nr:hypothetical protein [Chloroflexia bacterium]